VATKKGGFELSFKEPFLITILNDNIGRQYWKFTKTSHTKLHTNIQKPTERYFPFPQTFDIILKNLKGNL